MTKKDLTLAFARGTRRESGSRARPCRPAGGSRRARALLRGARLHARRGRRLSPIRRLDLVRGGQPRRRGASTGPGRRHGADAPVRDARPTTVRRDDPAVAPALGPHARHAVLRGGPAARREGARPPADGWSGCRGAARPGVLTAALPSASARP